MFGRVHQLQDSGYLAGGVGGMKHEKSTRRAPLTPEMFSLSIYSI